MAAVQISSVFLVMALTGNTPSLSDQATVMGLDFQHQTGATGQFLFPEIAGAGCALFDLDNDGDLDAWLVQSGSLTAGTQNGLIDRIYRNDLNHKQAFVDITADSGVVSDGYGMGVAVADVDGDDWLDVLVTQVGHNVLYRNLSGGRFSVWDQPALRRPMDWSTSAAFADVDRDGDLDLYIANYVVQDSRSNPRCYARSSRRDYCGPGTFAPARDAFFLNQDGELIEATQRFFATMVAAPGLGVVAADFNNDGWVDFYVANDGAANLLWLNQAGRALSSRRYWPGWR